MVQGSDSPILGQQFYSHEDINRLIEERIASRENLALKKPKEISGYLPSQNPPCPTQVDLNTEAIRQLLKVIKHAKKTLAKKSSPEREKANKIRVDHFLDEVLKNIDESSSDSSDSENSMTSSKNELETNTLVRSWNESGSDSSGASESSNSESDSEEYDVNAIKKITYSKTRDQKSAKVLGQKLLAKN
ncbi:hypothetical protein F8M41_025472 [Gigaspora margarita]|uniref:Uncharacterized protein n=1 Tax=Gigaspora margarita TaxID=4874 RepID=A0A8H4ABM0_GIGMA|nr:hypothetical protein F8M41_025472 [Gigaspora margarita]